MARLTSMRTVFLVIGLLFIVDSSTAIRTTEECVETFIIISDATRSEERACPAAEDLFICLMNARPNVLTSQEILEMQGNVVDMLRTYFDVTCDLDVARLVQEMGDRNHSGATSSLGLTWWKVLAIIGVSMITVMYKF